MTLDNHFSLELLAKIKWAQESPQVLEFFKVLDDLIPDKELVESSEHKKDTQVIAPATLMRSDIVEKTKKETSSQIIKNFPEVEWNEIKIPQVL